MMSHSDLLYNLVWVENYQLSNIYLRRRNIQHYYIDIYVIVGFFAEPYQ